MNFSPHSVLVLLALSVTPALADVALPGASYSVDAVLNPSAAGTDAWIYEETTPGNLTLTNAVGNLHGVLGGHAGAPGGNVELFPASETAAYIDSSAGTAFATASPVTLSGTAGSTAFTFRSLNGNDWFGSASGYSTLYGAGTLATAWFDGFIDSVASLMNPVAAAGLNSVRGDLFDEWRDSGGFASLSDANIGYVYESTATGGLNFGLEGFLDASPRFREFLQDAGYGMFAAFVPDGIQYSEVVMLDDEAYYSFLNGTPSGVQLDDAPFHSYTADFAFTKQVPEPSGLGLAAVALASGLFARRRVV